MPARAAVNVGLSPGILRQIFGQIRASPKRGEVYLVRFDPTLGAEISENPPSFNFANDLANSQSPTTIVAPITSKLLGPAFLTRILVLAGEGGLKVDSAILLNHRRSVDKRRLIKRLGA